MVKNRFRRKSIPYRATSRKTARKYPRSGAPNRNMQITARARTAVTPLLTMRRPSMVPDRIRVKLCYSDYYALSSVAGAYVEHLWKGNSVYDPDSTGVGHQPLGYDQLTAFYNRYRVYMSAITVTPVLPTGASTGNMIMALFPTQSVSGAGTVNQAIELPYSKYLIMSNSGNYRDNQKLFNRISTGRFLGYGNVETNENIESLFSTDPAHIWYWSVGTNATTSVDQTVQVLVKLVYDVEFFDRRTLTQSEI